MIILLKILPLFYVFFKKPLILSICLHILKFYGSFKS